MTPPPRPEPTWQGTQRRLRALAARSWSPQAIEAVTGIPAGQVTAATAGRPGACRGLHHHVAAAYDMLWDQPPPLATPGDQARAAAARARAGRHGWAPPMAWDDDLIDQPAARPAPGWKPSRRRTRRSPGLAEDLAFVRQNGGYQDAPLRAAAARLGVTRAALEKARSRAAAREAEPG